jgi:hypothetical protein
MNNKADEYRRNAVNCLRVAERTADLAARATLLDMAQSWRFLAEQADRNSATDVIYETPPKSPPQQPVAQQQQQIQPDQTPDEKKSP